MKSIDFNESNITVAKDQDQYLTLRAHHSQDSDGIVTTCWNYSWLERFIILMKGKSYLQQMTFKDRMQPVKMVLSNPVRQSK